MDGIMSFMDELYEDITNAEVEELNIDISSKDFNITNENQANFFLRRLSELNEEKNKINEACDKEIDAFVQKVNAFRNKELQQHENTEKYFNELLEKYANIELANSNKKSLKLPFGTLQYKTSARKFEYDDKLLMEYIKTNNLSEFIRTKEEINKVDLKKSIKIVDGEASINGEYVDGITVCEPETKFTIKL